VIIRYSDHAANERTFLAWVRMAFAVAFGGILAGFDLLRKVAARPHDAAAFPRYGVTVDGGLAWLAIGIALFVAAYQRFRRACWQSPLQPLPSPFCRHWSA
jgi:putative membrane protein